MRQCDTPRFWTTRCDWFGGIKVRGGSYRELFSVPDFIWAPFFPLRLFVFRPTWVANFLSTGLPSPKTWTSWFIHSTFILINLQLQSRICFSDFDLSSFSTLQELKLYFNIFWVGTRRGGFGHRAVSPWIASLRTYTILTESTFNIQNAMSTSLM